MNLDTFGAWLRAQLDAHDLTPDDFAADLDRIVRDGQVPRLVPAWIEGRALPDLHVVPAIAAVLDVPEQEIYPYVQPYWRFAAWLQEQMDTRDLFQRELAEAIDVSQATVSTWTRGIYAPSTRHRRRLAQALGIHPEQIDRLLGDARPTFLPPQPQTLPFPEHSRPADFLDPLIGAYPELSERERQQIAGIVRGYLESRTERAQ